MVAKILDPGREEALNYQTTFNQVRNAVGILIEIMEEVEARESGKSPGERTDAIVERVRNMGRNIARTYIRYWEPGLASVDEVLISIYRDVFGTRVSVLQPADKRTTLKDFKMQKVFEVIDESCPLCKGKRATNIAGCEVIAGFVEGIFKELHDKYPEKDTPVLRANAVVESRTRGDDRCVHRYVLSRPETESYAEL